MVLNRSRSECSHVRCDSQETLRCAESLLETFVYVCVRRGGRGSEKRKTDGVVCKHTEEEEEMKRKDDVRYA